MRVKGDKGNYGVKVRSQRNNAGERRAESIVKWGRRENTLICAPSTSLSDLFHGTKQPVRVIDQLQNHVHISMKNSLDGYPPLFSGVGRYPYHPCPTPNMRGATEMRQGEGQKSGRQTQWLSRERVGLVLYIGWDWYIEDLGISRATCHKCIELARRMEGPGQMWATE